MKHMGLAFWRIWLTFLLASPGRRCQFDRLSTIASVGWSVGKTKEKRITRQWKKILQRHQTPISRREVKNCFFFQPFSFLYGFSSLFQLAPWRQRVTARSASETLGAEGQNGAVVFVIEGKWQIQEWPEDDGRERGRKERRGNQGNGI